MKPRIGISVTRAARRHGPVEEVNRSYVDAVARVGALPFLLPILDRADALTTLAALDGLLLSGGGDVDPSWFGSGPGPMLEGVDAGRDAWEIALVQAAFDLGLPVLGICRGAQVLNVAAGGTLVAHLPDVSDEVHRTDDARGLPAHTVRLRSESRLARIIQASSANVNSLHHQAVATLGSGLHAVAWSNDGHIEAIETSDARAVGVQWHPELLCEHEPHRALFGWLVTEASARALPVCEHAAASLAADTVL